MICLRRADLSYPGIECKKQAVRPTKLGRSKVGRDILNPAICQHIVLNKLFSR